MKLRTPSGASSHSRMKVASKVVTPSPTRATRTEVLPALVESPASAPPNSELDFRTLLESMNEGALHLSVEGTIIYANARFLEMSGADPQRIIGDPIFHFTTAAERIKLRELLAASWNNPQREEFTFRKCDDQQIPALFSARSLTLPGGVSRIALVITDLTPVHRRLAELEAVYRTAPVGLAVLDKSLCILRANQSAAEILGDSLAHLAGLSIFDAAPSVANTLSHVFERALQHGESVLDLEVTSVADEETPVEHTWIVSCRPLLGENHEINAISLVLTDTSEHKRTEMERIVLSRAIEQAADSVLITRNDGTIVYANPACEKISGFSRAEMLGQTPRMFKSGKHPPEFYQKLWETLLNGNVWSGSTVNRRKDGTLYEESATISPVRDAQGRILNFVASKRDVTHERQLESQLHLAQKFEALGRLSGGIAHDFNNVLGAIVGWAELGADQTEPGSKLRTYFEKTQAHAERAAGLVRQLLAYCRRQILERTDLDLNQLVGETVAMLGNLIGKHIEIRTVLAPDLHGVRADAGQVEQVILNLCLNARDAMVEGGRLVVETRNVTIDEIYCLSHFYVKPGSYVQLSVADTGAGMAPETLDHIFEPFFTTKEVGKGTGLGLATVYGIVKQHEGFVHVYSELSHGTVFHVYFPALVELTSSSANSPKIECASGGHETLLFAEDHDGMRETTSDSLSEMGYHLLVAKNGAEAVELFNAYRDQIDLAILDVVMPGMGGPEALAQMRRSRPGLLGLFMTGYASGAELIAQLDSESTSLLQKPFGSKQLGAKIREIFDARARANSCRN